MPVLSCFAFLGEKNSQTGSTFANPRFSECCSSGQVTPHFLLLSSCLHFLETHGDKEGLNRHPHPGEACSSCGEVVPKIIPTFAEPPELLRQLLTSKSAEARHFARIFVTIIVPWLWRRFELSLSHVVQDFRSTTQLLRSMAESKMK